MVAAAHSGAQVTATRIGDPIIGGAAGGRGLGSSAALLVLAGGLGAGSVALSAEPIAVVVLPVAIIVLWLISRSPEYGILLVLLYTSTILSEEVLPPVSIGVGSLHLSDLIVVWLLGLLAFRIFVSRSLQFRHTALDIPVAVFLGVCILSTLRAVGAGETEFDAGIRSLRHAGYLVLFFLITNLLREPAQMRRLWSGLGILAALTAIAAILQAALGPEVPILPGRVEELSTQGMAQDDIARVIPPGESLLYLLLILSALTFGETMAFGARLRRVLAIGLLGIGMVLTYRRALWASAVLALIAALPLMPPAARMRLVRAGLLGATLLATTAIGTLTLAPDAELSRALQATGGRLVSLVNPESYRRGDSDKHTMEQRLVEIEHALPQALPPTLIGHGLAATYRPCLWFDSRDCTAPSYIHNGYVAVLLNLGLVGAIAFIWMTVGTLRGSYSALGPPWRGFRHGPGMAPARVQVLAATAAFVGLLPALMLEPYFFLWSWSPVIAVMLATVQWWQGPLTAPGPAMTRSPLRPMAQRG